MKRPKVGSILAAAALATAAVVPLLSAPAGATATGCDANQFPASFAAQSMLKVDCNTNAGDNVNHIEIHDADNANWHHGAARSATLSPGNSVNATTSGSTTIKFAAGSIQTRDIRRPINAFDSLKASIFKGGTFIRSVSPSACTTACTSAIISQSAAKTELSVSAKIEMTNNRSLTDATCTGGTPSVTSTTAGWASTDVGKSISGGPFASGTYVVSVSGTTATLNQAPSTSCSSGRIISVGANKFVSGAPVMFTGDPESLQLGNTTVGGAGFTCTSGGHTLAMTAAAKADTGGFTTGYAGMAVVVKVGTTTVSTVATAGSSTTTNTSLTLLAACPSGITSSAGQAQIGTVGADTPTTGAPMMTLSAELNLNPVLVSTQDECALNTFEGFQVVGGWQPPGTYSANAFQPPATVAQVVFPTSVIAFNGFVVPKKSGDSVDANPHFNYSFPLLPTSLAVCLTAGLPANPVQLAFGMNPTVKAGAPFLATGSGNNGDPAIRQLLPETGTFSQTMQLIGNPSTVVAQSTGTPCTIGPATDAPGLTCGDG